LKKINASYLSGRPWNISRDMTFPTVLRCIITAVDSAHKDQYIYKTAERIPQQHFDGTTTSLRVVIFI
jgi:hypothetical protein